MAYVTRVLETCLGAAVILQLTHCTDGAWLPFSILRIHDISYENSGDWTELTWVEDAIYECVFWAVNSIDS